MEPTDVTPPQPDDRRLESWLKSAEEHLPDAGFTARVLASLPDTKPAFGLLRFILVSAGAALGLALAFAAGLSGTGWIAALEACVVQASNGAAAAASNPWSSGAVAVAIAVVAFAWPIDDAEGTPP